MGRGDNAAIANGQTPEQVGERRLPAPLARVRVLVPYVFISVAITVSTQKYQKQNRQKPVTRAGFCQAKWDINQRV